MRLFGLFTVTAFAKSIRCVTCAAVDEFLACDGVPSTLQSIVNTPAPVYDTVGDLSLEFDIFDGALPSPEDFANVQFISLNAVSFVIDI